MILQMINKHTSYKQHTSVSSVSPSRREEESDELRSLWEARWWSTKETKPENWQMSPSSLAKTYSLPFIDWAEKNKGQNDLGL